MPRLVYASSSSVYGLNKKQPFSESDRVDNPASLYASTKRVRLGHTAPLCHTTLCEGKRSSAAHDMLCSRSLDRTPAKEYCACSLQADELICHAYYNIYSMSVTGLRFFTVYGPWGRPDMAAFKFAINIMRGKPITIFQVRREN